MAVSETTQLPVIARTPDGSRSARRLRRAGLVPGVVYGGGEDPISFQINARDLRHALASAGAVFDLRIDGAASSPVVVKEVVRHPVNGEIVHLDLVRVRLDVAIQALVPLELTGAEQAPGIVQGGVLEHVTREVTIEALPNEIPDVVTYDISELDVGATLLTETVAAALPYAVVAPDAETVIATITAPRLQTEADDEIETETEVVGEAAPEGAADADAGAEAEPADGESGAAAE